MRGNSPPAVNARKTCCRHGHPYDDRNTYRPPGRRRRDCRACIRDRVRRYKARERARAERERQAPELLPLAA
jgi:hypothetical protein